MKTLNRNDFPSLFNMLDEIKRNWLNDTPFFYHVTKKRNLASILKDGLKSSYFGDVHGEMDIRPKEKGVYLSRHEKSNNLNSSLFDNGGKLVVLKIENSFIDQDLVYPDDGMFAAFANEDLFFDADELTSELGIDVDEADKIFSIFENTFDADMAELMKPLWPWYLKKHGEISTSQGVPAHKIVSCFDYETEMMVPLNKYKDNKTNLGIDSLKTIRSFLTTKWKEKHEAFSKKSDRVFKTEDESLCRFTSAFLLEVLPELTGEKWEVEGGDKLNVYEPVGGFKDARDKWHGHYWVTNGKVIVDLTAKQFGDKDIIVTSANDKRYHENYTPEELKAHLADVEDTVMDWLDDYVLESSCQTTPKELEMQL